MACNCYSVGDSSLLVVRWIPPLRRADRQTSASASAEGRIVPFTDMKQFDENCMFPTLLCNRHATVGRRQIRERSTPAWSCRHRSSMVARGSIDSTQDGPVRVYYVPESG